MIILPLVTAGYAYYMFWTDREIDYKMIILLSVISVLLTCICLFVVKTRKKKQECDGYFHVNTSDPDKDVYTLDLMIPLGDIPNHDSLIFKVKNISQEHHPL